MAREKPFHNPFLGLKLPTTTGGKAAQKRRQRGEPRPSEKSGGPAPQADSEAELFLRAVGEVQPVRGRANQVVPAPKANRTPRILNEEEEVLAELCELVAGRAPFALEDSDEFIEGAVSGLDKRLLRRLRTGEYAIQGHLDLHGLNQVEAKEALIRFVESSRSQGKRCVLVIHGKGLHSKDQIPVLKEGVQRWLTKGRLGSQVLAFSTAKPHDGGTGAVYVLLRR